jgi:hypothetical protein
MVVSHDISCSTVDHEDPALDRDGVVEYKGTYSQ